MQGYFVWLFLDVFEQLFGYRLRFSIYGVGFNSTARTRYQRHSTHWFCNFLQGGELRFQDISKLNPTRTEDAEE